MSARTIFVMLYVGAIESDDVWFRPDQPTRMTDEQAAKTDPESRLAWAKESLKPRKESISGRWYAQNTREPIRDETLRNCLTTTGAVIERKDLPTTSAKPRYALKEDFASFFDPSLAGAELHKAIEAWQNRRLSSEALARIRLMRKGLASSTSRDRVFVQFPNGETRSMSPGPSSEITKALIEDFATRFLGAPGVLWISESGAHVVARDDDLSRSIGLDIQADRNLPDIILVDLEPEEPLIVFCEVVATDGPINEPRQQALLDYTRNAGFKDENIAFVTAYMDRGNQAFRRTFPTLAWRSFAWCVTEPDNIIALHKGAELSGLRLRKLME
jgi:hypothetical protein